MKFANPDNVDMPMSNAFCRECGCLFFFPENMGEAAEVDRRAVYCPNGHGQTLNPSPLNVALMQLQADFEIYKKRRSLEANEYQLQENLLRGRIEDLENTVRRREAELIGKLRAQKETDEEAWEARQAIHQKEKGKLRAEISRLKRRAVEGLCPVCNLEFNVLAEHLRTKHPIYCKNTMAKK